MKYPENIPDNQIWYTTEDGKVAPIDLSNSSYELVSNKYKENYGVYTFKDTITELPAGAFLDFPVGIASTDGNNICKLTTLKSVKLPNSIKKIGTSAFNYADKLEKVYLPQDLEEIGEFAFYLCKSLTYINIPASVKAIGRGAFRLCDSLKNFADQGRFLVRDRYLYGFAPCGCDTASIPDNVEGIADFVFDHCTSLKSIIIHDEIKTIGRYAFADCTSLSSMCLPKGLQRIEECTFLNCSEIVSIELPLALNSIGDRAFQDCSSLRQIDLPLSLNRIEWDAFVECCSLASFHIPHNVDYIGNGILLGCENLLVSFLFSPPILFE